MDSLIDHNIILINLDGLRRDKIEFCPTLNFLSKNSYYFSKMNTVAPYTFASLHAVFSGMYPSRNGVNGYYNIFKFKKKQITTLTQILKNHNYFTCCDIIDDSVIPKQGFDEFNIFDENTVDFKKRHDELISKLSKKSKFFLFLHFTETHKFLVREVVQKYKQEENDDEYFSSQQENTERYNSYLPSCDDYVKTILNSLKNNGIDKKTILIIFSDHGTSIGEKKGEKFYGVYTYDYTLNVFCIINFPEITPQIITQQCRTIDILPTISELIGNKLENHLGIQGESLIPLIEDSNNPDREVFVETGGLYGPWPSPKKHNVFCIKINNKKLIYNDVPETWEFYDLIDDPFEIKNIYDEHLHDVKELKNKLMFYFQENEIETKLSIN
ncbi:putative Sulfatase [metagenome]